MGTYAYDSTNDELIPIAGQGKAEYGASTVRTGTFTNPALAADDSAYITVTFSEPMPDDDYIIQCYSPRGANVIVEPSTTITANGFDVKIQRIGGAIAADTWTFSYTAFKLYTDTEYNNLIGETSGTGTRNATYISENDFFAVWYKVGRICQVDIQFNTSQELSSTEEIITGLPAPIRQVALVGQSSSNTTSTSIVIKANGAVRTHYITAAGQFCHVGATYITAE